MFAHSALSTTTGGDNWNPGKQQPFKQKKRGAMMLGKKENKKSARFTVKDLQ